MYDKRFIANAIERSAETAVDRRRLLTLTGLAGAGAAAAAFLPAAAASADTGGVSDGSVLNFALNLEYLEAEFYLRAAYGEGLPDSMTDRQGPRAARVSGGHQVPFKIRRSSRTTRARSPRTRSSTSSSSARPSAARGRAPVDLARRRLHRRGARRPA